MFRKCWSAIETKRNLVKCGSSLTRSRTLSQSLLTAFLRRTTIVLLVLRGGTDRKIEDRRLAPTAQHRETGGCAVALELQKRFANS